MLVRIAILIFAALLFTPMPVISEDSEPVTAEAISESPIASPLSVGFELYQGTSNLDGVRHLTDGMWAGNGAYYPSITYVEWNGINGDLIRTSMGVGRLYTEEESATNQPVEMYWKKPLGKATLTIGKFYIPFAQQEWLYEAQWGAMSEWTMGRLALNASANYRKSMDRMNYYLKGNYQLADDAQVALSLAAGKGFCVDSSHGRGFGLDTNIGYCGWRFYGEYNHYEGSDSDQAFNFLSGKLYYEKLGKFQPFIAKYWWKDDCGELGNFRSNVLGADYELYPWLTIQGALSNTSDGTVSWLQLTTKWQTGLFGRGR